MVLDQTIRDKCELKINSHSKYCADSQISRRSVKNKRFHTAEWSYYEFNS